MDEKNINLQEYQEWILSHHNQGYEINIVDDTKYVIDTDAAITEIRFNSIDEFVVVEFEINSKKDEETKFYLHFELTEKEHSHEMYDEMIESLLALQSQKTLQVLLSCSAGLTTYMFAEKMNEASQNIGFNAHFEAVPYTSIYEVVEDYDIVLIAPQISYMYNRIRDSLPEKLVLRIPTNIFASYDAFNGIKFIQEEMAKFIEEKKQQNTEEECCCHKICDSKILTIVIVQNQAQTRLYYRYFNGGNIIDSNMLIKPSTNYYDLDNIIDTVLVKYKEIDLIGIATPGKITSDHHIIGVGIDEENIKERLENKYHIDVLLVNNTKTAVVGFGLAHNEYKNILFHSQPFGYGCGGQALLVNGQVVYGKEGISGEIRYFLKRMQFSDEIDDLAWTEQGVVELVTKSILPAICLFGPEAVAIRSPMTPDMEEIKKKLLSFVPEDSIPEFFHVKDAYNYMLDGLIELCNDSLSQ